jgi:hypothetical protein
MTRLMNARTVKTLNEALTLEYLEVDFYQRGIDANIFTARERTLLRIICDHERAQVGALTSAIQRLGGMPAERPAFQYPSGTFTDRRVFLTIASTFEQPCWLGTHPLL